MRVDIYLGTWIAKADRDYVIYSCSWEKKLSIETGSHVLQAQ